jgi:hypothetical protein
MPFTTWRTAMRPTRPIRNNNSTRQIRHALSYSVLRSPPPLCRRSYSRYTFSHPCPCSHAGARQLLPKLPPPPGKSKSCCSVPAPDLMQSWA